MVSELHACADRCSTRGQQRSAFRRSIAGILPREQLPLRNAGGIAVCRLRPLLRARQRSRGEIVFSALSEERRTALTSQRCFCLLLDACEQRELSKSVA